jgi:hypothetical protein
MVNIANALKSFGTNLAVGYGIDMVRGWLNEQLKRVSPSDLYEAILQDRNLWNATPDKLKNTGHRFKGSFGSLFNKHFDKITPELLLKWMREDHQDLFSTIINSEGGVIWFAKQVDEIKQQIRGM